MLALAYVAFVGLTFAGAPGLGGLEVAGLEPLTNPAGEQADVGRDPVEQAVPDAVAGVTGPAAADGADQGATSAEPVTTVVAPATTATAQVTTTTAVQATTTTTRHGHGPTTSVPGPNSTVPDKGGPPTSRPSGQ